MGLELLDVPADDTIVWRYLDFPKYVDLISNKRLFFMRCDKLLEIDPYEGLFDELRMEEDYMSYIQDFEKFVEFAREEHPKHLFVNCWHMNENESDAMWKTYSKDNGIAIKTNFGKLKECLKNTPLPIYANKVRYTDYSMTLVYDNVVDRFSVKNSAYCHENELRLLYPKPMEKDKGLYLEINPNLLIREIIVSPTSEEWLLQIIKSISEKFGIDGTIIRKSTLYQKPIPRHVIGE